MGAMSVCVCMHMCVRQRFAFVCYSVKDKRFAFMKPILIFVNVNVNVVLVLKHI